MSDLADLIARVEGATTRDDELGVDILRALDPMYGKARRNAAMEAMLFSKENPTDSIDAALSLVERKLPGFGWERIIQPDNTIVVHIWSEDAPGRAIETRAGTSVAICLALLRSLQAGAQN